MSQKLFIAVAGNIGTGKSTLTKLLADRHGWKPYYEAVQENPYLEDFYGNMSRWSFPLQIYFLTNRFKVHNEIMQGATSAVQDRSIYEDANIFARNLHEMGFMDDRDYGNYLELYQKMLQYITPPDVVVYLQKSVPKLKEYIHRRGRAFEAKIDQNYLARLNDYYDDWFAKYDGGKKLLLPSDDIDFVHAPEHFELVSKKILDALDQKQLFTDPKKHGGG